MTHKIKICEAFADAVLRGDKTFEIRNNDRGYQTGDVLQFTVVSALGFARFDHSLNDALYRVTYVLSGWGLRDGYVALGIKEVEP